jgi:hypothetical protein
MFRLSRRTVSVLLVPALLVSASCSTDESAFGPTPEPPSQQVSTVTGATTSELLEVSTLLTCSEQPDLKASKAIGPQGGTITVGNHKLVVPRGALSRTVTITAEQVRGSTNSVRFAPEGLQFAKSAEVTLSYGNCVPLTAKKRVVYTDELLKVLELLPSKDANGSKTVTGKIDHFSRYAVAY